MPARAVAAIGIAIVAIFLAILAFMQQQTATTNEATAVANAQIARTAQAEAQEAQEAAVFEMNIQATGQANAQQSEATAQAARATAEQAANEAVTAQSEVEASAVALAADATNEVLAVQLNATIVVATAQEDVRQALTAQANAEAQLATYASQSTADAATAYAQGTQIVATAQAVETQVADVVATATAHVQGTATVEAAVSATASTLGTQTAEAILLTGGVSPESTIRRLVADGVIPAGGIIGTRLEETVIDMTGEVNKIEWEDMEGEYEDVVVSTTFTWGDGLTNDSCGLMVRKQSNDDFYMVSIDRRGILRFDVMLGNEWQGNSISNNSTAIRIAPADTNRLTVVATGDTISVYINGTFTRSYTQSGITEGGAAVQAATDNGEFGAGCTFTDAWVWVLPRPATTSTPSPTPQATASFTPTPTFTPTATLQSTSVADADAVFEVPWLNTGMTTWEGSLSFKYPAAWTATEVEGQVVLSSSESAVEWESMLPSGEMVILIGYQLNDTKTTFSLEEHVDVLIESLSTSFAAKGRLEFSEPERFFLGSREALRSMASGSAYDMEVVAYLDDQTLIGVISFCAPGEGRQCEPILMAIAKTVAYFGD